MRMRRSIADIEAAFAEEMEAEALLDEEIRREALERSHKRRLDRTHRHGSIRFALLILVLIGTAVLVTIAMFQTLYYVMG
jgi:hypothetical protein